jgi:hypothetical protein
MRIKSDASTKCFWRPQLFRDGLRVRYEGRPRVRHV